MIRHLFVLAIIVLAVIPVLAGQRQDTNQGIVDSDPEVRLRAVETLPVNDDTVSRLVRTLDDADAFVRAASRNRLSRDPVLLSEVMDASRSNTAERYWARNLLLNFLRDDAETDGIGSGFKSDVRKETLDIRCLDGRCLESWVGPVYMPLAISAAAEGKVWVSFLIDDGGTPTEVTAKGHPLLADAAKASVEKWRFSQGSSKGKRSYVVVDYRMVYPSSYTRGFVSEMHLVNYVAVFARRPR
jgi:hypothetical protein